MSVCLRYLSVPVRLYCDVWSLLPPSFSFYVEILLFLPVCKYGISSSSHTIIHGPKPYRSKCVTLRRNKISDTVHALPVGLAFRKITLKARYNRQAKPPAQCSDRVASGCIHYYQTHHLELPNKLKEGILILLVLQRDISVASEVKALY